MAIEKYFLYHNVYFHNGPKHTTNRIISKPRVCRELFRCKYKIPFKVKRKYTVEELPSNPRRQLKIAFLACSVR